ncbi:MAG: arsenate reductase ArsC [Rudaea sp.]|uniref:arsenate reductase ArsC n=1 Tax=unclassified Rudaea TaxID=2627037 RepID=UPI0010F8AB4D|nr:MULTISPECIES: arsenate reductase ArsC [unclassified Rudaea]MBN8886308.1 arsenate reductase ArsC [Rudaea sp.]MBR0345910.1 arsenate reductase ArsC [Rudaea sp.]
MTDRSFNVLFLCTGNSARSILAESILAKDGAGRFRAYSAGSMPKGEVNPLALETLERFGYPIEGLRSKSWDEFEAAGAPQMDFVFTVCDNAAGEVCPIWPGHPLKAHWGIEDPAAVEGTSVQKLTAFATAFRYLKNRIDAFIALPTSKLEASSVRIHLDEIGRSEGATPGA